MRAPPRERRPHAPWFTSAWLAATSLLYVALVPEDGKLPEAISEVVSFSPEKAFAEPWRVLLAPIGILFERDAVQFSYVAFLYALAVPALEWREGWRRTALVFVLGGLVSVVLVTFLVYWPLYAAFPTNPRVEFAVERSYAGGSTGAFAAIGALAGVAAASRHRTAILAAALAWEAFIWGYYFEFKQLIPLFHVGALALGFAMTRSRWYARVPA